MTAPLSNGIEQALAEFERQKATIKAIQGGLAGTSSTVVAKNRAVSVSVDSQGTVTEIKFPTSAYRSMSGAELGDLVVGTIKQARAEALAKTVAAFESMLPPGAPLLDMVTGGAGDSESRLDKLLAEIIEGPAGGAPTEARK